jgi:hypothetical protein
MIVIVIYSNNGDSDDNDDNDDDDDDVDGNHTGVSAAFCTYRRHRLHTPALKLGQIHP